LGNQGQGRNHAKDKKKPRGVPRFVAKRHKKKGKKSEFNE